MRNYRDTEEKHMGLNTVIRENHNSSISIVKITKDPECGNILFTMAAKQLNMYIVKYLYLIVMIIII